MRTRVLILWSVLLFGCSKPAYQSYADEKLMAAPAAAADAMAAPAADAPEKADGQAKAQAPAVPIPAAAGPMLAYSYGYTLEAPPTHVRPLEARHEALCRSAGVVACQVTGSTIQSAGRDDVDATLSLRVAPTWLARFRDSIADEAKAAGGRVINATVASEDLSREIVDEQAAVRAKTALRDRLQAILQTRPGKTSDLVDVETALSKVQGELDTKSSELALSRERVATSVLTIEYKSAGVLAPDSAWAPLVSALNDFVGTMVAGLAFIVRLFAALLPSLIVIGIVVWLVWKQIRRTRKASSSKSPPAKPENDRA